MDPVLVAGARVFDGTRFLDQRQDVLIQDGRAVQVAPRIASSARRIEGGTVFPGFVDAHVHLAFAQPDDIIRGGVTAVLDLGAPPNIAFTDHAPLLAVYAGPLFTAPGGYPTQSWGANGSGIEVQTPDDARHAIALLAERGAVAVKVAIEPVAGPLLSDDMLRVIAESAHESDLKLFAHALDVRSVRSALAAGVDALAHTPVEKLPRDVVDALASKRTIVVSTLRAFGAKRSARRNLSALARAGCPVIYGTDLGNGDIQPGVDAKEIELLVDAFGGEEAALAASTSDAAALIGRDGKLGGDTGVVRIEKYNGPADLAGPKEVWLRG